MSGQHAGERRAVDRIGAIVDARDHAASGRRPCGSRSPAARPAPPGRASSRPGSASSAVPGVAQRGDRVGVVLGRPHRPRLDARLVVVARELGQRGDQRLLRFVDHAVGQRPLRHRWRRPRRARRPARARARPPSCWPISAKERAHAVQHPLVLGRASHDASLSALERPPERVVGRLARLLLDQPAPHAPGPRLGRAVAAHVHAGAQPAAAPPARAARPPAARARSGAPPSGRPGARRRRPEARSPRALERGERLAQLVEAGALDFRTAPRFQGVSAHRRNANEGGSSHMLEGLMQHDHPLTVQHIVDRMRRFYRDSEVVTLGDDGVRRASYGEVTARVDRLCGALRALGIGDGRPRGDLRVELAGAPRDLPRRAVDGRGAAHAEHPAVRRPAHLHREPRRGQDRLRRRLARAGARRRSRRRSRRSSTSW